MKQGIEIYEYDKFIDQTYNLMKKDLSEEYCKLARKYDVAMVKDGLGKAARLKHLKMLLSLGRILKKDWSKTTKDDIDNLVVRIMDLYSNSGKETETTRDHKKVLKIFWRWYKIGSRSFKKVGDPQETADIVMKKPADKITRESLIDDKELQNLLHACGENARDRAFLHVHYEAATRPGEVLSLQLKHVIRDKYGAVIAVDGKTGSRKIRLIESVPDLNAWLAVHPFKENPEAPLWILLEGKRRGNPMTLKAAQILVDKRRRLASIPKRINLQIFRHSSATKAATYLSDELMKKRMGWTKNSAMPSRYTHLTNVDLERAVLKQYGIVFDDENSTHRLPKVCNLCETSNSPDSKSCSKCGRPLNLKVALELEEKENENNESIKKEIEQIRKQLDDKIEEVKYGPTARVAEYYKSRLDAGDGPEVRLISMFFQLAIELLLPEDKKREMMKELEQAILEKRKPDLHKIFGTQRMTNEQVRLLQESLKNYRKKPRNTVTTNKLVPRFRVEHLENLLAEYN